MKKGKNFFYRIEPMEVLSEMIGVPDSEKGQWAVQFFMDLKKGIAEETSTEIAAEIIREAHEYRARRASAGKQGGVAKASNAIAKASNATIPDSIDVAKASNGVAISSKQLAVTEPLKPKSKDLSEYSDDFNLFWSAYPDKTGKGKANESWLKLKPPLETVLQALQWQRETQKWREGFVPNPATYLNQRRWEDSPPERERSGPITFEKQKSIDRKQAMIDFVMEGETDGKHQRNENQICITDG